jgi:hypothetical protein
MLLAHNSSISNSLNACILREAPLLLQKIMTEPVVAADGHTYERAAVQDWLLHHKMSPVTGVSLAHTRLVPNVLIRSVLARHQQQL